MPNKQLFSEKYCTINVDESTNILYAKWNGFLTLDQIKKGCSYMTDFIKKNSTKIHVSDHVDLKVLTEDCKNYLTQEWFPEVEQIGLTRVAALVSPNVFTRLSVEDVNRTVKSKSLTIETFNTDSECQNWLLTKLPSNVSV